MYRLMIAVCLCVCGGITAAEWISAGNMSHERSKDHLVQLQDGKILAVGDSINASDACEVFDPATRTWSATGSLNTARASFSLCLLSNGKVLLSGGVSAPNLLQSCELYDPATGQWTLTASMQNAHGGHLSIRMQDNRVLLVDSNTPCEIFDPAGPAWTLTGSTVNHTNGPLLQLNDDRYIILYGVTILTQTEIYSNATGTWTQAAGFSPALSPFNLGVVRYPNGSILALGGVFNPDPALKDCHLYDPIGDSWSTPAPMQIARKNPTAELMTASQVLVCGGHDGTNPLRSAEIYTTSGSIVTAPMVTARNDHGLFKLPDGSMIAVGGHTTSAEIFTLNSSPASTISASPMVIQPGESVSFFSATSDADGDPFAISWNFGDGASSTDTAPIHTFTAPGTYTVSFVATDIPAIKPALTGSTTIVIKVLAGRPTARFTTSDVVGFVGLPLTFDASRSTDDENGITAYAWNFGDGSPVGEGQVISRVYKAAGTYNVSLTVTDKDGFTPTLTRQIEILPADQAGLFSGFIDYRVRWDRGRENTDTLSVTARLNVGDDDAGVGQGTAVAVEILGQRFTATLDRKLRAKSSTASWVVTANTRRQSAGQVDLKVTIKRASLGAAFNQAGILASGDGGIVTANVPVKIEVAGRAFELPVETDFKFSKDGTKASGDGSAP